jgi:hypothetical protein
MAARCIWHKDQYCGRKKREMDALLHVNLLKLPLQLLQAKPAQYL